LVGNNEVERRRELTMTLESAQYVAARHNVSLPGANREVAHELAWGASTDSRHNRPSGSSTSVAGGINRVYLTFRESDAVRNITSGHKRR
jgi:hypothetical protein